MGKSAEKIWEVIRHHPQNIRFSDFCKVIEWLGFQNKGGRGSHRTYFLPGIREILDIQPIRGEAKPYQVRQLVRLVKEYKLQPGKGKKT